MNEFEGRKNSLRHPRWDYSDPAYYFVTLCTKNREPLFGEIKNGIMGLNDAGIVANDMWLKIPNHFAGVSLGEYVIMPNHVHGVIIVDSPGHVLGAIHSHGEMDVCDMDDSSNQTDRGAINHAPTGKYITHFPMGTGSLGEIIRWYKGRTAYEIRKHAYVQFHWQRNYYDHIIRSETGLQNITQYIWDNPRMWERDRNNPKNHLANPPESANI